MLGDKQVEVLIMVTNTNCVCMLLTLADVFST